MKKKALSIVLSIAIALCTLNTGIITKASADSAPVHLQIPNLGYDDDSITLIWEKGNTYEDIIDYNVYQNGVKVGTASKNFEENSSFTNAFIDSFYEKDTDNFHTDIQILSYKATGLSPDTEYTFTVKGVLKDGSETESSNTIVQKTTPKEKVFNILDYGAKDTGKIIDYAGRESEIKNNTEAIQNAIDECSEGGKVVIPAGTYTSGAIWLKSNMTLELEKGAVLSGSTNVDDYDQNYLLRDYSTDRRSWGLINAYCKDESLQNIRIIGEGTVDGNGWKYDDNNENPTITPQYEVKDSLDPEGDEYKLPHFIYGSNALVYNEENEDASYGLLAKDAVKKALANGYSRSEAYSTRPTLMILKGVQGIYVEGITVTNPAFHGMSFGDCNNVVVNSIKDLTYNDNNGDGIGLDSSRNCLVFNNFFDTGDDAINFASGLGALSKVNKSVSDVRIFNNFVRRSHGGIIAAGSHTGAWIENILAEDNVSNLSDVPFRFKSAPVNGGGIRNVVIRDNAVANPQNQAFMFTTKYNDPNQILKFEPSEAVAQFHDILVKNVTVDNVNKTSANAIKVEGSITDNHNGLNFNNVKFKNFTKGNNIQGLSDSKFTDVNFLGNTLDGKDQWAISDSANLEFTGSVMKNTAINDSEAKPNFTENSSIKATASSQSVDLKWASANDNIAVTKYIVETYLGDTLLHEASVPVKDTSLNEISYTESGLMPGLQYKFIVKAEDSTGNRTESGPTVTTTTLEDANVKSINAPKDKTVVVSGETGYTWTSITFNACDDASVRKYEIYVNGNKTNEVLNPSFIGIIKDGKISTNVGSLPEGTESTIVVKAINDKGNVFEYTPVKTTTWDAFDREAPAWDKDANLNVELNGNNVKLTWPKASDDTAILGYRVYINGKVLGDGKFTLANRNYTTTETSYEFKDLEPGTYTFKVEAGDTWWRASSSDVKLAAPTNWSGRGPSTSVEIKDTSSIETPAITPTETPTEVSDTTSTTEKPSDSSSNQNTSKTGDYILATVCGLVVLMGASLGYMYYSRKKSLNNN